MVKLDVITASKSQKLCAYQIYLCQLLSFVRKNVVSQTVNKAIKANISNFDSYNHPIITAERK